MWRLLILLCVLTSMSCRDKPASEPANPNQQAVDRAEKHVDQTVQQLELARQEAKHQQRLREIDRSKYESQVSELESVWALWRLWLSALALLLVIVLVWLAREIRLRRVLAHILASLRPPKGGCP